MNRENTSKNLKQGQLAIISSKFKFPIEVLEKLVEVLFCGITIALVHLATKIFLPKISHAI